MSDTSTQPAVSPGTNAPPRWGGGTGGPITVAPLNSMTVSGS